MTESTQRMALTPLTLADTIPTIIEVIADRISGLVRVPQPGTASGTAFYQITARARVGGAGPFISVSIRGFGPAEEVTVFIHVSDPVPPGAVPGDD